MAHTLQERYSKLVLEKLRKTLVTKDGYIFNTRYEGDPKAGAVKIPTRAEITASNYSKSAGLAGTQKDTTYVTMTIDNDVAVNEIIDGYDAAAVPDNLVADRLDSAGYSLALEMDSKSINTLETTTGVEIATTKTAATTSNAYASVMAARTYLSRQGVPLQGRFLIVSPEFHAVIMQDDNFIKQGDLSQELVMAGAVGRIGGFTLFEYNNLMSANTTVVSSKKTTTEFIAGHPNWCHRVTEWQVPVHVQDLNGSGNYIGASAVQGRKIYGVKVSKPKTLYIKRTEA